MCPRSLHNFFPFPFSLSPFKKEKFGMKEGENMQNMSPKNIMGEWSLNPREEQF